MKVVYKLLLVLILSLVVVSSVEAAVIAGVKVFHGGNFSSSIGGTFMLFGIEPYTVYNNDTDNLELYYKRVIVSSTIDDTVTIRNGTCESTKKYIYCFKGSTIDANNPKTYSVGDYLQSMITLTIESLPSPVSTVVITRNISMKVYCGELIPISISVNNTGTIAINITYAEVLPFNTLATTANIGVVDGNTITFKGIVPSNATQNFSYVMTNFDCKSKNWTAKYTFTTYNDTITRNISNIGIVVLDAYNITSFLSRNQTNSPVSDITYTWIINNSHPSIPLGLDISLNIPGAIITDAYKDIVSTTDRNRYVGVLPVRSSLKLYVTFHEPDYGNYTAYTNGTISIDNHLIQYNSSKTFQVLPAIVDTYLEINSTKNNSLYVSLWAQNYDVTEKYYYIYGVLKGIGADEPIYANGIDPDSTLLVAKQFYNTTGMGVKEINMVFDGIYRDKNSVDHKIHAEKLVLINTPQALSVNVTTKNLSITNITQAQTTTKGNTTGKAPVVVKKDFITKVIEGLSNFLQSIFG